MILHKNPSKEKIMNRKESFRLLDKLWERQKDVGLIDKHLHLYVSMRANIDTGIHVIEAYYIYVYDDNCTDSSNTVVSEHMDNANTFLAILNSVLTSLLKKCNEMESVKHDIELREYNRLKKQFDCVCQS